MNNRISHNPRHIDERSRAGVNCTYCESICMSEHAGILSFHILEDSDQGITSVLLSPITTPSEVEGDIAKAEHVFSVVNQTYMESATDRVSGLCYFVSKEAADITDYCALIQEFVSTVCDFADREYRIYLKISTF